MIGRRIFFFPRFARLWQLFVVLSNRWTDNAERFRFRQAIGKAVRGYLAGILGVVAELSGGRLTQCNI